MAIFERIAEGGLKVDILQLACQLRLPTILGVDSPEFTAASRNVGQDGFPCATSAAASEQGIAESAVLNCQVIHERPWST